MHSIVLIPGAGEEDKGGLLLQECPVGRGVSGVLISSVHRSHIVVSPRATKVPPRCARACVVAAAGTVPQTYLKNGKSGVKH